MKELDEKELIKQFEVDKTELHGKMIPLIDEKKKQVEEAKAENDEIKQFIIEELEHTDNLVKMKRSLEDLV